MKKWLVNLKISRKLLIGFSVLAIASIVVGAVGIIGISSMKRSDARLYSEDTACLKDAGDAAEQFAEIRYSSLRRLYADSEDSVRQTSADLSDNLGKMDDILVKCRATVKDTDTLAIIDRIQGNWNTYRDAVAKINNSEPSGENSLDQSVVSLGTSLQGDLASLSSAASNAVAVTVSENASDADRASIIMAAVIAAAIILSVVISLYISAIISGPIQKLASFAEQLAVGDTETGLKADEADKHLKYRKDEIGTFAGAFNKIIYSTTQQANEVISISMGDLTTEVTVRSENDVMGKALRELVERFRKLTLSIAAAADQVDTGAKLVADSSTALSQGSVEQASSVEELTASLEEVTSQTVLNAKNAQNADELAKIIKSDAESGNVRMTEMLGAMNEISVSSDNISKIIKAIEDIAFQTNILALNAAVEAARAGQYGKGFAVVADEVKNLAAQSSKAAKGTTDLIEHSIQKVEAGTKIASDTAGAFGKIMEDVSKAGELIDAIAAASSEQSAALEQINEGVMQVSQVVQNNAAASEETAAASEELSSQADSLKESIGAFKLNGPSYGGASDLEKPVRKS